MLAVTFTNKAAAEMRGRIEQLLHMPAGALWVGTFHGLAHRLLRLHWREAGCPRASRSSIPKTSSACSSGAQGLGRREPLVPREVQWFINAQKDEGLRPQHLDTRRRPEPREEMVRFYRPTRRLRAERPWSISPNCCCGASSCGGSIRAAGHYRRRFRHVLVDEFQDTNAIQYAWLRLLAGNTGQAVLRRRRRPVHLPLARRAGREHAALPQGLSRHAGRQAGAELPLHRHHPQGRQRHHRQQPGRLGKNLWTEGSGRRADPPVRRVQRARRGRVRGRAHPRLGRPRAGRQREVAVLYRSNAQSRVFEEALLSARIPTASTAACGSSSAPRSRTRSPTCG
jgi:DNA helicase II / ATP-dependent DNA helicase PcrA